MREEIAPSPQQARLSPTFPLIKEDTRCYSAGHVDSFYGLSPQDKSGESQISSCLKTPARMGGEPGFQLRVRPLAETY